MRGTRELKRRIKSVQSTQKITRAMEMVSAAKLRRAQERFESAKPYAEKMRQAIARILRDTRGIHHPFLDSREKGSIGYLVVTADRGLCGGYNTNILRLFQQELKGSPHPVRLIAVGKKVRDYGRRQECTLMTEHLDLEDYPTWPTIRQIAAEGIENYLEGNVDELNILYTSFVNPIVHRPQLERLLPLSYQDDEAVDGEEEREKLLYRFEPDPEEVLAELMPRYVEARVYGAILEAKASEHGARMAAMRSATTNAGEMIERLMLDYNKARQSAITQEILEIVNTSEALK